MKKLCWLAMCLLVFSTFACDDEEEAAEETEEVAEEEEEAAEETEEVAEEEDGFDSDALIEEHVALAKAGVCDRPFECFEEHDEFEAPEELTLEQCYENVSHTELKQEIAAGMERESIEACAEADAAFGECLEEVSCEDLLTFIEDVDPGEESPVCNDEWEAQNEACGEFMAQFQAKRAELAQAEEEAAE